MATQVDVRPKIAIETRLFIGGAFVDAIEGGRCQVINPHDNTVLCEISEAGTKDVDRAVRARRLEYEQLLVGVIDRGRKRGVFHTELSTNVLLYGILGMCAWATQWYDPKRAPAPEVIGRNYARMVINGLTAPITA